MSWGVASFGVVMLLAGYALGCWVASGQARDRR